MKDKYKSAVDTYAEIFQEILNLPELAKSKEVLVGESLTEIVKHALERQYLLGAIGVDPKDIER